VNNPHVRSQGGTAATGGYPRIVYTDLDTSWLLAEWHEVYGSVPSS
jgi:hypothetical protein